MFIIKQISLLPDCKSIELVTLGPGSRESEYLVAEIEDV